MLQNKKRFYIIVIFVGIAVLFGVLVGIYIFQSNRPEFPSDSDTPPESGTVEDNKQTEFKIESTKEDGEWIVVKTTYGSFKYPYAFSDLIGVEAIDLETSAQLRFYIHMEDREVPIYTIYYNTNEGSLCGKLKLPDVDEKISVSVVFGDAPENLSDGWQITFYATQETFNDVLFSMAEDEKFDIVE